MLKRNINKGASNALSGKGNSLIKVRRKGGGGAKHSGVLHASETCQ